MSKSSVSKPVAISAALSTFAMVAFVLFAAPAGTAAGAKAEAPAPAGWQAVAGLPLISD